jgi:hypothetical protein
VVFESSGLPANGTPNDAVRRDADASYGRAAAVPFVTDPVEKAVISALLGRPSRGESAVAHRCVYGIPTVVRVSPRLQDGTPFPTVFWLTCPLVKKHVGTLEADQVMVGLNERLQAEPELAEEYAAGSDRYVAFRDELGGPLPANNSAGGMPGHIKCLHVHAGHTLATGDNPIGNETLDRVLPLACDGPCVDVDTVLDEWGPGETKAPR